MSRLLAIAAREAQVFRRCLRDDRRSLAVLGREQADDGWGIAVHDPQSGWKLREHAVSSHYDPAFDAAIADAAGSLLVAQVCKRPSSGVALESTHPLRQSDWIFAHTPTLERVAELRAAIAWLGVTPSGKTNSEMLFAFLMGTVGSCAFGSRIITNMMLARAVGALADMSSLGSFVLSDGVALYAYRHGCPLYLLKRHSKGRLDAILVASEPVTTNEAWMPVADRSLFTVSQSPELRWGEVTRTGRDSASLEPR